MIPVLFEQTEINFTNNGIGLLTDCIICKALEDVNGSDEIEMEYPVNGIHYLEITHDRIILAKPNYLDEPQPFRIYKISKAIGGVITVNAHHISYDLSGTAVKPFSAKNIVDAMNGLKNNAMIDCPFTFSTTRTTVADFKVDVPSSIRSWLGGKTGSLLDVYGGEYHFDRYNVTLENHRGSDRGVVIRYGKNLTDLKQEEECSNVYTGVLSYYKDTDGNVVIGNIVAVSGSFPFTRTLTVDCSSEFKEAPSVADLDAYSTKYINSNNVGVPNVNLTVSFIDYNAADDVIYWTDNEGNQLTDNENNLLISVIPSFKTSVNLGDTVKIYFTELGITATAECIKTTWNVLLDCYDSIELGNTKSSLADTIANIQKKANDAVTDSFLEAEVKRNTAIVTGAHGGYARLIDTNGDGYPDEFVASDNMDLTKAVKVFRINMNGFGGSSEGYSPEKFNIVGTLDGHFSADYITTGTLKAIDISGVNIYGSTIQFGDDTNYMKMYSSGSVLNMHSTGTYGVDIQSTGNLKLTANTWETNEFSKLILNAKGNYEGELTADYGNADFNGYLKIHDNNIELASISNAATAVKPKSYIIIYPARIDINSTAVYFNGTKMWG